MQTMRAVRIVMAIRAAMPANAVPTVHVAALASRKGRALKGAPKKAEVQFTFVYNSPPVPGCVLET